ncbi:hypothetical protein COR50_12500 [Chitinophaga caeni]|uniref:Uncharacterized protein n=1 Tax=Chitinophaga caeni TaxID=2029983 RepID=A0A291QVK2_9BACT|nr:PLDc N-terminal domain-containing protein [Chitinophaga caeni]ATL47922.1 hypothetical protein COR50_12500 [Chitinophaga caeni]
MLNSEIWLMLAFLVHMWLVSRFVVMHTFKSTDNHRPYHLKWLMLVFFLPYLGYLLYFYITAGYNRGNAADS